MRYPISAVRAWIDEDRELRAAAELSLHTQDPERIEQETAALLSVLQHATAGTSYVLLVRDDGEALLLKQ